MSTAPSRKKPVKGEPAWSIATLYPNQGYWDEYDYLELETNHLVEFSKGFVEVLPMPTQLHQAILLFLYRALFAFVDARGLGTVMTAPLRVRIGREEYREPDILFMLAAHDKRRGNRYWKGADLVMEVVSDGAEDRRRDLIEKRRDYAKGRIPEYWIVDPRESSITVLRLSKGKYLVAGQYGLKDQAKSVLLPGFEVSVASVLVGK
jgi:Uma2 family endonuclease